jgi:hypothetical protein
MILQEAETPQTARIPQLEGLTQVAGLGFLTKFRFAKTSRNWLRNDFRVSGK